MTDITPSFSESGLYHVALLSHRGGNIGHDFMAAGFETIVKHAFAGRAVVDHYEQHEHFCVCPVWHPLRRIDRIKHGKAQRLRRFLDRDGVTRLLWSQSKDFSKYTIALACGGPNIVRDVALAPEMGLMFHHLNGAFHHQGVPTLDLSVGCCFPLERVPDHVDQAVTPADRECFERLFRCTTARSVRDALAHKLWSELGGEPKLIPCGAFCCAPTLEAALPDQERDSEEPYVLVNYQAKGANSDWGQGVDVQRWQGVVSKVIETLQKRYRVVMVAHNAAEQKLAHDMPVNCECVMPKDVVEYARWIRGALAGFVSRIHAAIPLASFGVPSVTAGNDTRLYTVKNLGLPVVFAKQAEAGEIIEQLDTLIQKRDAERMRLLSLRDATLQQYVELIRSHARGVS